jgi:hypothetical protein
MNADYFPQMNADYFPQMSADYFADERGFFPQLAQGNDRLM